MSNRVCVALAASALAVGGMLGTAAAKTISYEVNGKRYTYESTSRKEVAAARKLIEAANAADRARAAAAEEQARNPLVTLFGSETQRAAAAAQAYLERAIAEHQQVLREPSPGPTTATAPRAPAATETEPKTANAPASEAPEPKVQSVHFDPTSGIKTTFLANGSIVEELADPSVLSRASESEQPSSTVARPQDAPAPETTGSTTPPQSR